MHSTQPRSPTNLSSYLSFAAAGPNGLKINRFTDGQDAQAQPPGAAASDCLDFFRLVFPSEFVVKNFCNDLPEGLKGSGFSNVFVKPRIETPFNVLTHSVGLKPWAVLSAISRSGTAVAEDRPA
jgi:hypothetical protein